MNLHQMVRGAVGAVNPFVSGQWQKSTGYTTGGDGAQAPTYAAPATLPMQVQPLTGKDLKQLEGMNVQGVQRTVYMQGDVQGVNQPRGQGGDLLTIGGEAWLVVVVLETWAPGWCKVGVTLQVPGS